MQIIDVLWVVEDVKLLAVAVGFDFFSMLSVYETSLTI